jgi:hypothetical protein
MAFVYIITQYNYPCFDEYCRICGLPFNNLNYINNKIDYYDYSSNFDIKWMEEVNFIYNNHYYNIHNYDGFGSFIIDGNIDNIPSAFTEKYENYNKLFFSNSIYNKSFNLSIVHKKCINRKDLGNINELLNNNELPYDLFNKLNFYQKNCFNWKLFFKNYSFILNNPIKDNYWLYPEDLKFFKSEFNYNFDIYYKNILFENINIYKDLNLNYYIKIDNFNVNFIQFILQLNDILNIDIFKIIFIYYKLIYSKYIDISNKNVKIIDYYIYNNQRYNVYFGKRNGTYILINNKKKYIKYKKNNIIK